MGRIDSCSVVKGQGSYAYVMRAAKLISLVSIASMKIDVELYELQRWGSAW